MSTEEITSLIALAGLVLTAIIGGFVSITVELVKSRKHSRLIAAEVTPNHGSSMRDAVDRTERMQLSQAERIDRIERAVDRIEQGIHAIRADNARQDRDLVAAVDARKATDAEHGRRLDALEHPTQTTVVVPEGVTAHITPEHKEG